jgi:hypothetical protein
MPCAPVVQRKMFGYPAGFIIGTMFTGLFRKDTVSGLPKTQREEFLKKEGVKIIRPMRE